MGTSGKIEFLRTEKPSVLNISNPINRIGKDCGLLFAVSDDINAGSDSFNHTGAQDVPPASETEIKSRLQKLSDEKAESRLKAIASEYTSRADLTAEDYQHIIALNQLMRNLNNSDEKFMLQLDSEGAADGIFNKLKELTGLGITKDEIKAEIKKNSDFAALLKKIINKDKDAPEFNAAWKSFTGRDFNFDNLQNCIQKSALNYQAAAGMQTAASLENELRGKSPNEVLKIFRENFSSEGKNALSAFNSYYERLIKEGGGRLEEAEVKSIKARQNGREIAVTYTREGKTFEAVLNQDEENPFKPNMSEEEFAADRERSNINFTADDLFRQINIKTADNHILQKRFEKAFKAQTKKTPDEVLKDYQEAYKNVFGESSLNKKLNDYINSMGSYAKKLSIGMSLTGIGLSFINPAFGYLALSGVFADNGINAVNMMTNNNSRNDWQGLAAETAKEAAFTALGMGINCAAQSIHYKLTDYLSGCGKSLLYSQTAGTIAEVISDGVMSIGSDVLLTGDLNLSGNSIGLLIDIVSGIRGYKAMKALKPAGIEPEPQTVTERKQAVNLKRAPKLRRKPEINPMNPQDSIKPLITQRVQDCGILADLDAETAGRLISDIDQKIHDISAVFSRNNIGLSKPEILDIMEAGNYLSSPQDFERSFLTNSGAGKAFTLTQLIKNKTASKEIIERITGRSGSKAFSSACLSTNPDTNEFYFKDILKASGFDENTADIIMNAACRVPPQSLAPYLKNTPEAVQKIQNLINLEKIKSLLPSDVSKQFEELFNAGLADTAGLSVPVKGELTELVKSDIDLLYRAYKQGGNIRDAFIRPFNTEAEAKSALNPGDIAHIGNSGRISMMLDDGSFKQFDLSPDTYFKLFPPIKRYTFCQQQINDCYLLSFIHGANENISKRAELLSCFTEEADTGNIKVKMPEGRVSFTLKPGQNIYDSMNCMDGINPSSLLLEGAEGLKLLEYTAGLERIGEKASRLQAGILDKAQSIQYIQDAIDNMKAALASPRNLTDRQIDVLQDNIARLQRDADYWERALDADNTELLSRPQIVRGSGTLNDGFKVFGSRNIKNFILADVAAGEMRTLYPSYIDRQGALNFLSDSSNWNKYLYTAGSASETDVTRALMDMYEIQENHAYSIIPCEINGSVKIRLVNPHNTSKYFYIPLDEFFIIFDTLSCSPVTK